MLKFILNNTIFDYSIIFLLLINFVLTIIIDLKEQKNESKNIFLSNKINKIKMKAMIIAVIFTIITLYIKFNNFINIIIYLIIPAILLIKNIFDIYKKEQPLSTDNKFSKLLSMNIFVIFFSSAAVPVYYKSLASINHNLKEILLIIYLIMRIILFVFLFLNNIAILLSNINILKLFKIKDNRIDDKFYKLKDYNFHFYRKYNSKLTLYIDTILYFLLSIPTIIYNLVCIIRLKLYKFLLLFKNNLINIICNINNNSNKIIRKITNISIIIAFSIVHIIIIINSALFSDEITQIYDFLSTVILIPFIYDSIKSKS